MLTGIGQQIKHKLRRELVLGVHGD
jgi:hypothetical protein